MEISQIKTQLTIGQVLDYYHLKADTHHKLHCPWHADKTPSLQIYPQTNSWTCFSGNCSAGSGDAIEFIEKMEKQGKHHAITKAKELLGHHPSEALELSRIAVLSKISHESRSNYKKSPKARNYIQSRNLDPDQLEAGYIGVEFGKSWNASLQQSGRTLGLFKTTRQNTHTPKFKHTVVFFTKNAKGQTVGIYGRSIQEKTEIKHLYLSGKHQGLYPEYPNPNTKHLILTESIIDAATLIQSLKDTEYCPLKRTTGVLALYGTNGFTPDHAEAIGQLEELQETILFLDGDKAGQSATQKIAAKLGQIKPGVKITTVPTPEEEDINSLHQGHEPELFTHLLKARLPISMERKPVTPSTETKQETIPKTTPTTMRTTSIDTTHRPVLDTGNPDKIHYQTTTFHFTIWGGIDLTQLHKLKINLHVQLNQQDWHYYQDDVNLYSNSQLQRYITGASEELETSSTQLKQTLSDLKTQLENYRTTQRETRNKPGQPKPYPMTQAEEKAALSLLKSPHLAKKTMESLTRTGLVGEQKNGLLLYLLYLTRHFDEPLHAIIFGKSGSGKTYLQTKISDCLPEESVRNITSLSENVLYYSPKGFWQHVVLVIEDLDGVYQALLALRELMSKQSITKYTTDKDTKGNNIQKALTVEGPVSVSGATTKEAIYEDNANRSFLLYVDESPTHLEQVMDYQRKIRAGIIDHTTQEASKQLLKNAQRLLDKNINIYNPYALQLKLPPAIFKPLRTNEHYLKLIDVIAFYHQKQRPVKTHPHTKSPYIEVTLKDIEIANNLVKESLLRKSDELNGELRQFFEYLKNYLYKKSGHPSEDHTNKHEESFYAKDIRKERRLHPMKLARYLSNLERRGYIKWIGGSKRTGYQYQIIAWQEYEQLQEGMHLLDKILEELKARESTKTTP